MPQPFLGTSFRACPSRRSRASLEAASPPAVIHRRARAHHPGPYHRRSLPTPTRERAVADVPRRLWVPFPRAEARFPVALGPKRRSHSVPPASPTSGLSSPRETVLPDPSCPGPASRCSPGRCAPLETAHVRPSDPSPARASPDAPWPPSQGSDAVDHDPPKGTAHPRRQVGPPLKHEYSGLTRSADSSPLQDRPAPPLSGVPTPSTFS
jgi:hypothetical protein